MATLDREALAGLTAPFGRDVIEQIIPHRDPFLFLDEIVELDPGTRGVARWRITGDEWFLPGHFPTRPIVPGVVMVEALAQTCAVVVLCMPENHGKQPLFAGIDTVRFKRVVVPGDELVMTCEVQALRARVGKGTVAGHVDGELALRGTLMFATAE